MKPAFPYEKLGPRVNHLLGCDSLWAGSDHLLVVRNRRFVEDYLRFDWREIQALVLRKQRRLVVSAYWLVGWILAASSAAILGIGLGLNPDGGVFDTSLVWVIRSLWSLTVVLLLYRLGVWLFGGCSCRLQTAVGAHDVPSLHRLATARKVLPLLEARIAAVQGTLGEDWEPEAGFEPPAPAAPPIEETSLAWRKIVLPLLACAALFTDAWLSWLVRAPHASRLVHDTGVLFTLITIALSVGAVAATRSEKRLQGVRILFIVAAIAVGTANYGNTVAGAFATAARQNWGPAINEFFYWMNQTFEIAIGLIALLYVIAQTQRRFPSAP